MLEAKIVSSSSISADLTDEANFSARVESTRSLLITGPEPQ